MDAVAVSVGGRLGPVVVYVVVLGWQGRWCGCARASRTGWQRCVGFPKLGDRPGNAVALDGGARVREHRVGEAAGAVATGRGEVPRWDRGGASVGVGRGRETDARRVGGGGGDFVVYDFDFRGGGAGKRVRRV